MGNGFSTPTHRKPGFLGHSTERGALPKSVLVKELLSPHLVLGPGRWCRLVRTISMPGRRRQHSTPGRSTRDRSPEQAAGCCPAGRIDPGAWYTWPTSMAIEIGRANPSDPSMTWAAGRFPGMRPTPGASPRNRRPESPETRRLMGERPEGRGGRVIAPGFSGYLMWTWKRSPRDLSGAMTAGISPSLPSGEAVEDRPRS